MKLVKNPQVTQPNRSHVIKEKSIQSFRSVFRTRFKILAFVHWTANTHISESEAEVGDEGTRAK